MPTPTEPVKRVCYADDLSAWATGVNIPDMEDSLNSCLEEITAYLKETPCYSSHRAIGKCVGLNFERAVEGSILTAGKRLSLKI